MGALGLMLGLSLGRAGRAPALFDFAGPALPAGATLTRTSAGARVGPTGLVTTDPANAARFDHDPLASAPLGLLIEDAATNVWTHSEQFDDAAWAKSGGATVVADAGSGPDGAGGADAIVLPATSGARRGLTRSVNVTLGAPYELSFFMKAGAARYVQLLNENSRLSSFLVNFDLQDGVVTSASNVVSAGAQQLAGGWRRLWLVAAGAVSSGPAGVGIHYVPAGDSPLGSYTPPAGTAYLIWGGMAAAGAQPTSYVATGAATATRGADALTLAWGQHGAPDGPITVRYGFDDGSSQDIATTVANGVAAVPTTLARARIRRAERVG
jgi:hypothetical protein